MFIPCQLYFNYNRFCVCYQQQAFPHLKSLFFCENEEIVLRFWTKHPISTYEHSYGH